jgi:hypothetical protein
MGLVDKLTKIEVSSGSVQTMCEVEDGRGATWRAR